MGTKRTAQLEKNTEGKWKRNAIEKGKEMEGKFSHDRKGRQRRTVMRLFHNKTP